MENSAENSLKETEPLSSTSHAAKHRSSVPRRSADVSYVQMAAWVNWRYACAHGYDLLFLHLAEAGCRHAAGGHRHPSYCKLPAIAAALSEYRTVAFLDSDSWFRPGAPSLDALVRAHRGPGAADRAAPAAYFAWDLPFSNGPNAGFMLWRMRHSIFDCPEQIQTSPTRILVSAILLLPVTVRVWPSVLAGMGWRVVSQVRSFFTVVSRVWSRKETLTFSRDGHSPRQEQVFPFEGPCWIRKFQKG